MLTACRLYKFVCTTLTFYSYVFTYPNNRIYNLVLLCYVYVWKWLLNLNCVC